MIQIGGLIIYFLGMIIGAICVGAFVPHSTKRLDFIWMVVVWPAVPIIYILVMFGYLLFDYVPRHLVYFGEYLRRKFDEKDIDHAKKNKEEGEEQESDNIRTDSKT